MLSALQFRAQGKRVNDDGIQVSSNDMKFGTQIHSTMLNKIS